MPVPDADLLAPLVVVRLIGELTDQVVGDEVFDFHFVGCRVAAPRHVEIDPANLKRILSEMAGDVVHDVLDGEHAMRPAKAAERRGRLCVRPAAVRDHAKVLEKIAVVDVHDGAVVDRAREIHRIAAARGEHDVQACDTAFLVEAGLDRKSTRLNSSH